MKTPKTVLFFRNGSTAVFDAAGQQIPELQEAWIILFAKFLESHGFDPTEIEYTVTDGQPATVFRVADNFNWRLRSK